MRSIGVCERAMSAILARSVDPSRKPFKKLLKDHDLFLAQLAGLRLEIEYARLLVLNAADMIDRVGAKGALRQIAMAKVLKQVCEMLTYRLLFHKSLEEFWIELFKFLVQRECLKINCLRKHMLNLVL